MGREQLKTQMCSPRGTYDSHVPCYSQVKSSVAIDTYDDHRMAMAFSLTACGGVPVIINDPGCTRKTFPTYFKVFESVAKH